MSNSNPIFVVKKNQVVCSITVNVIFGIKFSCLK